MRAGRLEGPRPRQRHRHDLATLGHDPAASAGVALVIRGEACAPVICPVPPAPGAQTPPTARPPLCHTAHRMSSRPPPLVRKPVIPRNYRRPQASGNFSEMTDSNDRSPRSGPAAPITRAHPAQPHLPAHADRPHRVTRRTLDDKRTPTLQPETARSGGTSRPTTSRHRPRRTGWSTLPAPATGTPSRRPRPVLEEHDCALHTGTSSGKLCRSLYRQPCGHRSAVPADYQADSCPPWGPTNSGRNPALRSPPRPPHRLAPRHASRHDRRYSPPGLGLATSGWPRPPCLKGRRSPARSMFTATPTQTPSDQ